MRTRVHNDVLEWWYSTSKNEGAARYEHARSHGGMT